MVKSFKYYRKDKFGSNLQVICNHIPVNTNLRPVPADHTNDIRHSSTFPQGPGSDYFLILDVTPPMSN